MTVSGTARSTNPGSGLLALASGLTFIARRKQLLLMALLMGVIILLMDGVVLHFRMGYGMSAFSFVLTTFQKKPQSRVLLRMNSGMCLD